MADAHFIKIGAAYYPLALVQSVTPLDDGDVVVTFSEAAARDAEGQPASSLRVADEEAQGLLAWVRSRAVDPRARDWDLPERMT